MPASKRRWEMSPPEEVARLTLAGSDSAIGEVQAELAHVWSAHPEIDLVHRMAAETALVELVANVVRYALRGDGAVAELRVTLSSDELRADISDPGPEFTGDLHHVTMPEPTAESGRGLSVIIALVDVFSYSRLSGTNHWSIVRRLTPPDLTRG